MFSQACVKNSVHRSGRDGHCSGRYASYWNAFLLFNDKDISVPKNQTKLRQFFVYFTLTFSFHNSHPSKELVGEQS